MDSITNKRARIVIQHILEHGHITTEELLQYGYKHAPRAARDVRELGIPLETFTTKDSDGKSIAAYRFGDLSQVKAGKLSGRMTFPKSLKSSLYKLQRGRCAICNQEYQERYLQIDHRVPYEIGGDELGVRQAENFMLLCGSCNRSKSWSCEQCKNWQAIKDPSICRTCYWASPDNYNHIAMSSEKRIELVFTDEDTQTHAWIESTAKREGKSVQEIIKALLKRR